MTILPWGKAYGVFNIKWIYVFNVLLFEIGSAICGASPNMTVLIIARVIAGIGGCGMHSGCLTYIAISTTMKERPMYMSGIAMLWGLGSVLGPVVSSVYPAVAKYSSDACSGWWCVCDQQCHLAMGT